MRSAGRLLCVSCCAALVLSGCGKDDSESARFNETIGGRGPLTVSGIDAGLLQDPSAYKPASAGGGALGSGGEAPSGSTAAAGGEADAAKTALLGVVDSMLSLQAPGVLDPFESAQVQILAEADFQSSLQTVYDAFSQLTKILREKVSDEAKTAMDALPEQFKKAYSDALTITIIDPETAHAAFDPAKLQSLQLVVAEFVGKVGLNPGAPAGGPPPGTPPPGGETPARVAPDTPARVIPDGGPPEQTAPSSDAPAPGGENPLAGMLGGSGAAETPAPTTLKKIDGKWRIQLPATVNKEVADLLKEGCELTHEFLSQVSQKIDPVPANDPNALQSAFLSMWPAMGPLTGWAQRLQTAWAENVAGAGKKPSTEPEKKEETPASPGIVIP